MAYVATVPYADETYATAYFADRRTGKALWDAAADKPQLLAEATRIMNMIAYVGDQQDPDNQVNAFPRSTENTGDTPDEVLQACCEVAVAIAEGKNVENESDAAGLASEQVGDASASYEAGGMTKRQIQNAGLPSATAARLLAPWLVDYRSIPLTRI